MFTIILAATGAGAGPSVSATLFAVGVIGASFNYAIDLERRCDDAYHYYFNFFIPNRGLHMNFIDLSFSLISLLIVICGFSLIKWNQNNKLVIHTGILLILFAIVLLILKILD